jgi:predicted nucleotidyltransferase
VPRLRAPALLADSLSPSDRLALDAFVARARARWGARLGRLAVFGSRARGDADAESDIDVLAVVADADVATLRGALRQLAAELNVVHDSQLSVLVIGEAALGDLRIRERRLAADLDREAIDL